MKLSESRLKELKQLLYDLGINLDDDQLQRAGLSIARLVLQKELRRRDKKVLVADE